MQTSKTADTIPPAINIMNCASSNRRNIIKYYYYLIKKISIELYRYLIEGNSKDSKNHIAPNVFFIIFLDLDAF